MSGHFDDVALAVQQDAWRDLLAPVTPLRVQEVASAVATTDAHATADLVLDVAIKAAITALTSPVGTPAYRAERARLLLERAGASADRILGRTTR